MKLRWRKRPSATVLHFNVLMTLGSALPLAISSLRPDWSIGARQPVRAVLATAWFMSVSPCGLFWLQTVLSSARGVPTAPSAKTLTESAEQNCPRNESGLFDRSISDQ